MAVYLPQEVGAGPSATQLGWLERELEVQVGIASDNEKLPNRKMRLWFFVERAVRSRSRQLQLTAW